MYRKKIQQLVRTIAQQYDVLSVPVDVERLAFQIGADIKKEDFDIDLSGFAVQRNGSKFIGVNATESDERQRFTIAHELGHLFLHGRNTVSYDTGASVVLLRDSHSSDGTDMKEIEANRFAAELLMPEGSIRKDIAEHGELDLISESESTRKFIEEMANKYQVSRQAMTIRLTTLYFN